MSQKLRLSRLAAKQTHPPEEGSEGHLFSFSLHSSNLARQFPILQVRSGRPSTQHLAELSIQLVPKLGFTHSFESEALAFPTMPDWDGWQVRIYVGTHLIS
jgi:hypothetical protein